MITAYCSVATNKTNLKILSRWPWRYLLSTAMPGSVSRYHRNKDFLGYAIDNGAYADHVNDRPFQADNFMKIVKTWGSDADWIVIPDSIGNAQETIQLAKKWIGRIPYKKMICVQDGMLASDLKPYSDQIEGVFIGGTTDWKIKSMPYWSKWAKRNGKLCHVGRVNTTKRLQMCIDFKCTSFDGSGMARFADTAIKITNHLLLVKNQIKLPF